MRKAHCQFKLRIQKGKKEKGEVCTPAQYSIERVGVSLLPLYVMIVHCRVTQSINFQYPFIHLGAKRYCKIKVSHSIRRKADQP